MITRNFKLFLNAGKQIPLMINASQYDHGEKWVFTLYDDHGQKYEPSSGAIVGIKADNKGIINTGTVNSAGQVEIMETQQITAAAGKAVFELVIDDGTHGTANFVVLVEEKPGNNADLSETDISMIEQAIEAASTIKPYGSPLVASTVAGMTDHDKVYVYVGSETGYTSGHWYYYDGDSWEDGGVYNSVAVQTDTTLTLSGVAADAKKTGDEISDLKSQIAQGMPFEVKTALDSLLHKVGFLEDSVDDLAVIHAWATDVNLVSISAVFTQGANVIYDTDSLDYLKQFLVVTATYDNGTTAPVSAYTLSGELTEGTSVITATYEGKSASFNVTVTHAVVPRGYTAYDYLYYTGTTSTTAPKAHAITSKQFTNLNNVIIDFDFMPLEAKGSATPVLGGSTYSGSSDNNKVIAFFTRTDTKRLSCFSHGTALAVEGVDSIAVNSKSHANLNPGNSSPSTLTVGEQSQTGAWTSSETINCWLTYCGNLNINAPNSASLASNIAVGIVRVYDLSNNLLGELIPCVRDTDNVIGIYDTVEQAFHTASTAKYATIGNADCKYAVGNWEA